MKKLSAAYHVNLQDEWLAQIGIFESDDDISSGRNLFGRYIGIAVMDNYAKGEDIFMNRIKKLICVILGCVYLLFNLGIFMVIRTNLLPLSLVNLFVEAILNISLSTMLLFLLWYGSQKLLKIER